MELLWTDNNRLSSQNDTYSTLNKSRYCS